VEVNTLSRKIPSAAARPADGPGIAGGVLASAEAADVPWRTGRAPGALAEVAAILARASDVTLLAHVNPDADALGSALALGLGLRYLGATVRVSFGAPANVPESLARLDVAGLVVPAAEVPPAPPVLVAMDTASADRLGQLADRVDATIAARGEVVVVDHHTSNTRFGTQHLVDEHAEAAAVVTLELLDELRVPVDEPIAQCLYAALVTDTRSFRHARPSTHALAARLLAAGVDAEEAVRPLLDTHPFGWLSMLSTVLGSAQLEPTAAGGRGLVHTTVRLADADGLRGEDVDSVIDLLRTTSEADVAAVLKEVRPGEWMVSLRADSRVNVGAAAVALGGGGHRRAAGFTARGSVEHVLAELRTALEAAPLL
jgi:bifunctional oligoribonuclease and PAP phosphatase NrnA